MVDDCVSTNLYYKMRLLLGREKKSQKVYMRSWAAL
jgi:hypothetical protein